ncbi:MAG: UDP-GlcNAc--UDP-phosphate GlcNAc-phosphate transferase [Ferruginibacter sp.]|nr:UDP-GlcNAc--UDP-phosphate GlcNAc-phosphate transferase [Ferruginibacter sp.]
MQLLVEFILALVILMIAELVYFKIAVHFNIIDKPNERSSHSVPTIRGGGIIFLLAAILFFLLNGYSYPFFLTAMLASGIISFVDDVRTLNNGLKFSVHLMSVLLIFWQCGLLTTLSPLYLIAIGIVIIGIINAYNFMDGINGITGLYSLAVIVPLLLTETNGKLHSLELVSIAALLAFNFFNARKKARCFAGDVGGISLAILIVFLLILRIQHTNNFIYIGLLLIYGIDSVYTIAQRIYQKENIFKPHRKHLYQYFSNEKGIPHLLVSVVYAFIQLLINLTIVYGYVNFPSLLILLIILSIGYWALKVPLIRVATH